MPYYCNTCKECVLTSLSCLCKYGLPLSPDSLPSSQIRAAINLAQMEFVEGCLKDCFAVICEALRLSSLSSNDPEYVALPEYLDDLMRQRIIPLMVQGTLLKYVSIYGLEGTGIVVESIKGYMGGLHSAVNSLSKNLELHLIRNPKLFPCYKGEEPDKCKPIRRPSLDFAVSRRYPHLDIDGCESTCWD